MSAASINKIHVTNSTGLSLNERFTAISTKSPTINNRRSRSRSRSRSKPIAAPTGQPTASVANRRFLEHLVRQHKMQAALKLKRRSMRPRGRSAAAVRGRDGGGVNGGVTTFKRSSIKALRIAANGHPIKANTLTNTATMNADFIIARRRPQFRSNSVANRTGRQFSRPYAGGAAERVAKKRLERLAGDGGRKYNVNQRGRSRSRSRSRNQQPRDNNVTLNQRANRSRSRSRSRARQTTSVKSNVPIQARLGFRQNSNNDNRIARNRRPRNASTTRRGVQDGRVIKRNNNNNNTKGAGAIQIRGRSRSRVRRAVNANERVRTRSRLRRGSVGQQQQQQQQKNQQNGQRSRLQPRGGGRRQVRGRIQKQQRLNGRKNVQKTGNNTNGSNQGGGQRRGRSRSRGARNGARNLGNPKPDVKKEDLDNELDQYMSITKTGELDYLLN